MEIAFEERNGVTVVALSGRLDVNTSDDVQKQLMDHISDGCRMLLMDLNNVQYMSSYGLRVLLILAKRLNLLNGKIALCNVPSMIYRVLDTSGFSSNFSIYNTREEAFNATGLFHQ